MTAYQPSCLACRDNLAAYYKACAGCQVRRANAMAEFHKAPGAPVLPTPSSDGPVPMTYGHERVPRDPKDGPGWRGRGFR